MTTTRRARPGGRRPGDSGTRDAILDAALARFSEHGYDGASLRGIAADAGVDPALVRHFYGDKETLFTTVVAARTTIPQQVLGALPGDPATAGRRLADTYLRLWEGPETRPVLLALARSATTSARAAEMLRELLAGSAVVRPGSDPGVAPEAEDRPDEAVALAGSHLFGVAVARYVLAVPALARLSHDELVDRLAPTLQRYLDGADRDAGRPGSGVL